jgi:hypothetical protein
MKHYNSNKPRGYNSSKLEKYLLSQIKQKYPNLPVIPNDRVLVGLELDLLFPTINLAIELNGPTHYKPIYGLHRFYRSLENDNKKQCKCKEVGLKLIIIDVSKMTSFTEESAKPFVNLVFQILNSGYQN